MKKTLCQLALVTLPALLWTACGDITPDPAYVGQRSDLSSSSTDMAGSDLSACAAPIIFRLVTGPYPAQVGSGAIISDTCQTGIIGSQLETARQVQNDGAGNVTIASSNGSIILGMGAVRCNQGILTNGPITLSDNVCRFTANYRTELTVTDNNTINLKVTQTRTDPTSEAGQTCTQPSSCAITFKTTQKM